MCDLRSWASEERDRMGLCPRPRYIFEKDPIKLEIVIGIV